MFIQLEEINSRPEPFGFYTAADLWTDEHTSEQMLAYHLNADIDVSSRRGEFIDRSVEWIASRFSIGADTRIADFGCGPGLYANRLAKVGASVIGIDFSKCSIKHAREVAREAGLTSEYVNQNYLDFETEHRFDLFPKCVQATQGGKLVWSESSRWILVRGEVLWISEHFQVRRRNGGFG